MRSHSEWIFYWFKFVPSKTRPNLLQNSGAAENLEPPYSNALTLVRLTTKQRRCREVGTTVLGNIGKSEGHPRSEIKNQDEKYRATISRKNHHGKNQANPSWKNSCKPIMEKIQQSLHEKNIRGAGNVIKIIQNKYTLSVETHRQNLLSKKGSRKM